jgi:cardiolipin synthase A/B
MSSRVLPEQPPAQGTRAEAELVRALSDQAFSRAAGARLVGGNRVRLLEDARENYPAWLEAIRGARSRVHFESYIIYDDDVGNEFAAALVAKAREGARVRLVYDWLGGLGKTSARFWERLRAGGVEVRCYNPPRLSAPLGWLSRDHRKMLTVDGRVGFVTGLCIGRVWAGDPKQSVAPWRDTGIELRGPAVAELDRAFAHIWETLGTPLPADELARADETAREGDVRMRIIATLPATASVFRFDQLVAALARQRVWLTDAYFVGPTIYVQSLIAAARHGVDVRLLVPNATDVPVIRPLTRAGYRPLLRAGVRIFEWNGTMMHAKTSVADGLWSRVGSTNLNLASWLGNCELDAVIEDAAFARQMEEMYLRDLANSTELVLDARKKVRPRGGPQLAHTAARAQRRGSAGRAAAGAVRLGSALGAAFTNRRVLEPVEADLMTSTGLALLALALLFAAFPRLLAVPVAVVFGWVALALLYRAWALHRSGAPGPRPRSEAGKGESEELHP